MKQGVAPERACEVAVIQPITDDVDMHRSMEGIMPRKTPSPLSRNVWRQVGGKGARRVAMAWAMGAAALPGGRAAISRRESDLLSNGPGYGVRDRPGRSASGRRRAILRLPLCHSRERGNPELFLLFLSSLRTRGSSVVFFANG